jgi:hypothetical protein
MGSKKNTSEKSSFTEIVSEGDSKKRHYYPFRKTAVIVWKERHVIRFAVFAEGAWAHLTSKNALNFPGLLA